MVSLSILSPNSSLALNDILLSVPSLILMKGLVEVWPVNCLSSFSLVSLLFAVSTACLRFPIGNRIQYNFVGNVFLNTSKIWGSPYPKRVATCLILITYESMVSIFSSNVNDLHARNNCSWVLPSFEYLWLNKFCNCAHVVSSKGSKKWYHNLASPNNVRQISVPLYLPQSDGLPSNHLIVADVPLHLLVFLKILA